MLRPEAAPRSGAEQNIENSATIVGYRDSDGSWSQLGVNVLGGVALFEPNNPYNHDEQVLAGLLILDECDKAIREKLELPKSAVREKIDALLEKAATTRHGLLYTFLTADKPVMRLERLITNRQCEFSPRQKTLIDMLVRGMTEAEIAAELSTPVNSLMNRIHNIARAMRLPYSKGLLTAALILSDQAGLSVLAPPQSQSPVSLTTHKPAPAFISAFSESDLTPQLLEVDPDDPWSCLGIRWLGGVAMFEEGNPLTRRQQEISALMILGFQNKEIGRHFGISEDTVKTHARRVLKESGARRRHELLPTFLADDPPWMRIVRPIDKRHVPFTSRKIQVGQAILEYGLLTEAAKPLSLSVDTLKSEIRSMPAGIRSITQLITALTMSGYLDRQLAVMRLDHSVAARSSSGGHENDA